jgi:hypothetical protein
MLHHPMQNLTSAADDMTATGIPNAVADLTKFQILNQTSISVLAQADPMQQSVLKLLQPTRVRCPPALCRRFLVGGSYFLFTDHIGPLALWL